ncbi:MAG: phosphate/phosphite/phosphonate ABC transporter substrate-binding protein [Acetobacteraceae bacterium]|nr:phosphate/phosphite/phosphonate ABC transporter substrate-binding protein [Acetobacteraceae bacterium]
MSTGILTLTRRAALLGSVATAARAQAAGEISFGAVLSATAQTLHARWAAFLEDVSKVTGMRITGFFGADEAAVIEAMRTGKVQIASLSNETAIQAVDRAQAEVFAEKTYPDGTSFYRSLLIASKEGPLQSLEDVLAAPAGTLTFRDGEPNSVSGSLIPAYYAFAKSGIDAASRFKRVVTGDAETNLLAVAEQIVDFGTADTRSYERFRDRQPERALSLRKIWRGPLILGDPLVWRKDLPERQKQVLRRFVADYGADRDGASGSQERKLLAGLGDWGRFYASSDRQLVPFRQLALFREKLTTQADPALGAGEKAKRVRDIEAKLADLDRELARGG